MGFVSKLNERIDASFHEAKKKRKSYSAVHFMYDVVKILIFMSVFSHASCSSLLQISHRSRSTHATKIAANYPINPPLVVEMSSVDPRHSNLTIFTYCVSANIPGKTYKVCDPIFNLINGSATFNGSICEVPNDQVYIYFTTFLNDTTISMTNYSKRIEVTNEIRLAYFRPTWDDKLLNDQIEDFMRHSISVIHSEKFGGYPQRNPLPGRRVVMDTYKYDVNDFSTATKQYIAMLQKSKNEPHTKPYSILGMGSNVVSQLLLPMTTTDKIAVTSIRKDIAKEFSNKTNFPYFNRVHLSIDVFLDNIFLYLKNRGWNSLVIIYSTNDDFYGILWDSYAAKHEISLIKYQIDGIVDPSIDVNYDSVFDSIAGSGYRIIMTTVVGNAANSLIKDANRKRITSTNGYQWIGIKNQNSLDFLSSHSEDWCITKTNGVHKFCGVEFKGMIILTNYYEYLHNTTEAEFLWRSYYNSDKLKLSLAPRSYVYPSQYIARGIPLSLAYDALKANVLAVQRLIHAKKTITGVKISDEIRRSSGFEGLTGRVQLDSNGDRNKFIGSISILWPMLGYIQTKIDISKRNEWMERTQSNWIHSIIFEQKKDSTIFNEKHVMSDYTRSLWTSSVNSDEFRGIYKSQIQENDWDKSPRKKYSRNSVQLPKCDGDYNNDLHTLTLRPSMNSGLRNEIWFPKPLYECKTREIFLLINAPFYCSKGCGGKFELNNVNLYEYGSCVRHEICQCKDGWIGDDCSIPVCFKGKGCNNGKCVGPNTCACDSGYNGEKCDSPICSNCGVEFVCDQSYCDKLTGNANCTFTSPNKCRIGGVCTNPDVCECDANYFHSETSYCNQVCTCNMANGIECNSLTGHCSECHPGYYSPHSDCESSYLGVLSSVVLGFLVLVLVVTIIVRKVLQRIRLRAALSNNDWIVNWDEVKLFDKKSISSMLSAVSMNTNQRVDMRQFNCGSWDGIDVHYQILSNDSIVLSDAVRLEVKQVRDMIHENLSLFIGCCVDSPNVSILTELQGKGSLEDIFNNDDINLPWNFRYALLKGVCKGLEFIHKSDLKSHGRLKSSNCLVDGRWTIKLSGFGLHSLKASNKKDEEPNYSQLLWTAPEILKQGPTSLDDVGKGTQANDMYSLGILMSEFCTRNLPHSEVMLEKHELVDLVAGNASNDIKTVFNEFLAENNIEAGGPVRPVVKDNAWPTKYEHRKMLKLLMETCWDEDPSKRPRTVKQCENALNQIDPQEGELIEHLITMLEMYSNNLEKVIEKRTRQLQIESQRTEDLVSRLLPKSVSVKLKQGNNVEPENFEAVTVYFSDIVGFTNIAKDSTPFEVVAFLNKMYTLFDSISAKFDVYKVETIGDAYMIVSGLPTRNGDEHAAHICTTALHLMSIIGQMTISHLPGRSLRLRSGVHTGNVVAGVVGLKMPRYCLFGDSVQVASEMESGGIPCRIQISGETENILQRLGGYHTEYRDSVNVDSYGTLTRYFLNGKQGFDEPLPAYDPL